jgi:hypothetical protein
MNNRAEHTGYNKGQITSYDEIRNKGRIENNPTGKIVNLHIQANIYANKNEKENEGSAVTRKKNSFVYQFTICFSPDMPSSGDR